MSLLLTVVFIAAFLVFYTRLEMRLNRRACPECGTWISADDPNCTCPKCGTAFGGAAAESQEGAR